MNSFNDSIKTGEIIYEAKYQNGYLDNYLGHVDLGLNNYATLRFMLQQLKNSFVNYAKLYIYTDKLVTSKIKLNVTQVYNVNPTTFVEEFVYVETNTKFNIDFYKYCVDITNYIDFDLSNPLYFNIVCDEDCQISFLSDELYPKIEFNHIDYSQTLNNGKRIDGSVGSKLNYSIDVRNGNGIISRSLYSFNGNLNPINLSLVYNTRSGEIDIQSGFARGWKLNYFMRVTEDQYANKYLLLDSNGFEREFVPAQNGIKYFDSSGSGLILFKDIDGTFYITDNYTQLLRFNSEGYIVQIIKKIGNNRIITTMEYDSYNRVKKITDHMGNVVNIDYLDITIEISTNDRAKYVLFIDNEGKLSRLSSLNDETLFEFETDWQNPNFDLIKQIKYNSEENVVFTYDNRRRITNVVDKVLKEGVNSVLESRNLNYYYNVTKVSDYHNVITEYRYDNLGVITFVAEGEVGGKVTGVTNKDMFKTYMSSSNEASLVLNGDSTSEGEIELTTYSNTLSFKANCEYVISFDYQLNNVYTTEKEGRVSGVIIKQQVNSEFKQIGGSKLDLKAKTSQKACFTFKTESATTPKIYITHNNNIGELVVGSVVINEYHKNERKVCFNRGEAGVESIACENDNWHPRSTPFKTIKYNLINQSNVYFECLMYEEDIKENLKNYHLSNGGYYDLWYNKKRGLITNVKDVFIFYDDGVSFPLNFYKMCIVNETDDQVTFTYDDYSNSGSETNILRTEYQKVLFEGDVYENSVVLNRSYLPVRTDSFDQTYVLYQYDSYGNLVKEEYCNKNNTDKIVREYTYIDFKYLLTESTLSNNLTLAVTTYSYDSRGMVNKITLPNGLEYNYEYDEDTLELTKLYTSDGNTLSENNLTYAKDLITNMSHKGNSGYDFSYDKYNMLGSVKSNHNSQIKDVLTLNTIINQTTNESTIQYPNGYIQKAIFDKFGHIVKTQESTLGSSFSTTKEYYYSNKRVEDISSVTNPMDYINLIMTSSSKLRKEKDNVTSNVKKYYYNNLGLISSETNTVNSVYTSKNYTYDEHKRLSNLETNYFTFSVNNYYTYKGDNLNPSTDVEKIDIEITDTETVTNYGVEYNVDELKRLKSKKNSLDNLDLTYTYDYSSQSNGLTTTIPSSLVVKSKKTTGTVETTLFNQNYSYDMIDNIVGITDNLANKNISYEYDLFGRLIRENNGELNKTTKFTYDDKGNIIQKEEGTYSTTDDFVGTAITTYTYSGEYPDRLIAVNGQAITYDLNGNVTSYGNKTLTWTKNKQLSSVKVGTSTTTYSYNGDGIRIGNKRGLTSRNSVLDGNRILCEQLLGIPSGTISYIYSDEEVIGFIYGDSKYLYLKNLQNDIIGIVDSNGNIVARYVYDAWGNHKVCNSDGTQNTNLKFIGNINPFRYRGYYYDVETGLFMVGHRYYNPEWGRWTQPSDVYSLNPYSITGLNLYVYLDNNPVNMSHSNLNVFGVTSFGNVDFATKLIKSETLIINRIPTQNFSIPNFLIFGSEKRTSTGWDTSPYIATSWFGRFGISSYVTKTEGQGGIFYSFTGKTKDITSLLEGNVWYGGVGINLFNIISFEVQGETFGLGAQINLGSLTIGANINLIGSTSINIGKTTNLGNGESMFQGFTCGVNTGCLVVAISLIGAFAWYLQTGDPSLLGQCGQLLTR